MKLTFFSSVLGYHQEGLCNAFYELLGDDFRFVAYGDLPDFRKQAGFQNLADVYPYVVKAYTKEGKMVAENLIITSDVAIIGAADNNVIKACVDNGVQTYLFSERFLKKGSWRAFIPTTRNKLKARAAGYKQDNFKVLCASAYLPYDLALCGWRGKAYKWGYFPDVTRYDVSELMCKKASKNQTVNILWAARLIDWKHPEKALLLAKHLRDNNYDFHLNIIGYGELEDYLIKEISNLGLQEQVSFLGKKTAPEVRIAMENSDIFLMTSDYNEGWGVVVNEALNSGCIVIADDRAGSVCYLLENGFNGFTYRNDISTLFPVIEKLITDEEFRKPIQNNAYEYMINNASPQVAAKRFIELCCDGKTFENGVCSEAPIIKSRWF
ncbi:MAG: glycosyltransferase family 4 protein [Clostridia bacterium]|nr:glycosyltransferase family 4 protein [Clostridia bacterium]